MQGKMTGEISGQILRQMPAKLLKKLPVEMG
jgi:hypothetical protein